MKGIIPTKHYNYKTKHGRLAKGCQQCVKGEKLVLFVTGICGNNCPFCPVSDEKNMKDVTYANEWKITTTNDLITEARMMNAKGAGITGGDPLAVMNRTTRYIKLLKQTFGKTFHIHLYTPLLRVTKKNLEQLHKAGLDEIRFHPKLNNEQEWKNILLARAYNWSVGVEIPVIPGEEEHIKKLIDFIANNNAADFLNLNEFEYADNNVFEKNNLRVTPKNNASYAVKGSEQAAKQLLAYAEKKRVPAHFCTAKSKDAIQLKNRIKRRARKAAQPFDAVDEEGLLTRGAIYDTIDITTTNYTKKLSQLPREEKQKSIKRLQQLRQTIIQEWGVPEELITIDKERLRLLTTTAVAEHAAQHLNNTIAIVKEYPTHDCFLVEADIINKNN